MGAILLAILFGGVIGYRIVRPVPSALSPVAVPDGTAPNDPAAPVAAPAVAATPDATPNPSADVPPPPPPGSGSASRRTARRNAAPAAPVQKIIIVDPALAVEEKPAPPPEPVEAPKPEKIEPTPAAAPVLKSDSAAIPQNQSDVANDGTAKTDAHGKRIVKAFRRLLHMPKKDAQPETLKQP